MNDNDLIAYAKEARKNAYAPYSNFQVGAALLGKSGKVFTGCNVENISSPAGICAERCAVGKAISEGERNFEKIVIIGNSQGPCTPCGICRQVLYEFNPEMKIVMTNLRGDISVLSAKELLPLAFTKEHSEI